VKRAGGRLVVPFAGRAPAGTPLRAQIYRDLRGAILDGRLKPGERLPSTRMLSAEMGVSRNTAEGAYEQLVAEGYLSRRIGSGTFVASSLPGRPVGAARRLAPVRAAAPPRGLSSRGRALAHSLTCSDPLSIRAFGAGFPALDEFPAALWRRLTARRLRASGAELLGYGDPSGYPPLREAIARYVSESRGVRCRAEDVIVLTSSLQAIGLAARMLLERGDPVWIENPFFPGALSALEAAGARLHAVPVDAEGIRVDEGERAARDARLAYVTPSHQYPTGVTMSLERRLALLDWARRANAWILEDDYDSEFRYEGRPIAAIQGLDRAGRVFYLGTFTKSLFPSIRVAYLVVPPSFASPFVHARRQLDGHTATLPQAVIADFMNEGHFAAHLRRMRAIYRSRRDAIADAIDRELRGRVRVGPADGGFQIVLGLQPDEDDRAIARRAAVAGIDLTPLSRYTLGKGEPGLVLGYSALSPEGIREGVRGLAKVLRSAPRTGLQPRAPAREEPAASARRRLRIAAP
jgi:GntR family transcriptional regulator/MocR family aminotransferase